MALRNRRGDDGAPADGYAGKMPLYSLGVNNRGFAVAGGGGGPSKTGIANGLLFFKYSQDKIEKIGDHLTSGDAITSLDVHPEENLALFVDTDKFTKVQFAAGGTVLNTESSASPLAKNVKVLKFSPDASKVALGGFDGSLHVVSYPALVATASTQKAHTSDVDDVAWSPDSKLLATAAKDKTAKLFQVTPSGLTVKHTLSCEAEGTVLMPRGCRFSPSPSSSSSSSSPSPPSRVFISAFIISKATYIFVFNTDTGSLLKKAKIHNYHAASFAINAQGTYVAVGDVDGAVVVANADSLSKVMHVKPHGFFVPALAFTPPIKPATGSATRKREKGTKEKSSVASSSGPTQAVISVGADYACLFTPIVPQSFVNKQLIALLLALLVALFAIFINVYLLK